MSPGVNAVMTKAAFNAALIIEHETAALVSPYDSGPRRINPAGEATTLPVRADAIVGNKFSEMRWHLSGGGGQETEIEKGHPSDIAKI